MPAEITERDRIRNSPAHKIVARVCNEHRNSDLYASNRDVCAAFDDALAQARAEGYAAGYAKAEALRLEANASWSSEVQVLNERIAELEAALKQSAGRIKELIDRALNYRDIHTDTRRRARFEGEANGLRKASDVVLNALAQKGGE